MKIISVNTFKFEFTRLRSAIPLAALLLTACGGGAAASSSGVGAKSVAYAINKSAPVSNCPTGGITVLSGIDTNGNGVLDPSEVTNTQYVCNGANGANGIPALVAMTTEPAGANCATGGKKVSAGLDTNGNGILDTAEITSTSYICNGASGTNGTNGLNTLLAIVAESAGANCLYGGSKITSGLDTNANGVLDASEVTSTKYVCNGAPGATGPAGPGVTWVDVTSTTQQAVSNTGYMADNAARVIITLPVSPVLGDIVQVNGVGAGGWTIAQNASQTTITENILGATTRTWTARATTQNWGSVASSTDGTHLVAVVYGGQIYTSTDSGLTWTAQATNQYWLSVASSADGTHLVAAVYGGQIYTSPDSGLTWAARATTQSWNSVTSSADGTHLVAAVYAGQIYTSHE